MNKPKTVESALKALGFDEQTIQRVLLVADREGIDGDLVLRRLRAKMEQSDNEVQQ